MRENSMQRITDTQKKALGSAPRGFVPEYHPIRDTWLKVIDTLVRIVTLGNGRVEHRPSHRAPVRWNGGNKITHHQGVGFCTIQSRIVI